MFKLFCLLALILIISFDVKMLFNLNSAKGILASYIILAIMMLFSSMLGKLSYFKYSLIVMIVLSIIIFLIKYKNKKIDFKSILNFFLEPSLIIFIIFFVYLYFVTSKISLSNVDDLGFWGTTLKDMFRTNALYTKEYTVFGVSSYPPFSFLIEAVFCMILGGYSESFAIFSMASMSFSLLLIIFDKINKKDYKKNILAFILIILMTLMIQRNPSMSNHTFIYNSIYVDWLLLLLVVHSFIIIYHYDNKYDLFLIGLDIFALCMTKQIGLALALLVVVTTLVKLVFNKSKRSEYLYYLFYCLLCPLLIYSSWNMYRLGYAKYNYNPAGILVNSSLKQGIIDNQKIVLIKDFFNALFKMDINIHPFRMSYLMIIILFIGALIINGIKYKKDKKYYVVTSFLILGAIGYALGILLSYMYIFGDEGTTLALFGRYMQTFTYAIMVIAFMILFIDFKKFKYQIVLLIVALLFVETDSISTLIYSKEDKIYRENIRVELAYYFDNEYNNERLLTVHQTDMAYLSLVINIADTKAANIKWIQVTEDKNIKWFKEELENNDLIFVGDSDERFNAFWFQITDAALYNSTLYKINKNDKGEIRLELIYTWDE